MLFNIAWKTTALVALGGSCWMGIEKIFFINSTVTPWGFLLGMISIFFFFLLFCVTPKRWWDF